MTDSQTAPQKPKPSPKTLRPNRMRPAEFTRNSYHVEPQAGDRLEDLVRPEYWLHHAANLKGGDKIEMLWEDQSLYAEGIVLSADKKGASVCMTVGPVPLGKSLPNALGDLYKTQWAGPHAKHRVIRLSDGEIMKDGFANKDMANAYILSTLKAA